MGFEYRGRDVPELSAIEVAAVTERLVALDVTVGAQGAVGAALEAVRTVGRCCGVRCDGDFGDGERAALAELFQVAAWITFDAERHATSQRLNHRALELARGGRGGPSAVEPLILAVLCMQEEHLGRPAASLRIASSVLAREELPGRVKAIFQVRAGRALARLGRGPETLRALRTAAELLADRPTVRDPAWAWWFDRQELDGHHGLARAALGELDVAAELLHRAAHADDDGPAYRVLFDAELARVLAQAGDWREADTVMSALMGTVPAVGSVRALRAVGHATRLVRHGHRVPRRTRDTAQHLARLLRGTSRTDR
ncbi:DNA-binding protein [Streptomyces sp. NPDC006341]|uniref:DNA-binding protein n=1 Tax=Streptomyces sp. NPDC006341 TaxID=3156756 RepID=UPI0033A93B3A